MEEVGIYRVSGVATDIQALKTAFDTSECLSNLCYDTQSNDRHIQSGSLVADLSLSVSLCNR